MDPPSIHLIEENVDLFLKEKLSTDDAILTSVKTILDLVMRLLHFEWDCSRDQVTKSIENMIVRAEANLQKRYKEHREVGTRLFEILEELEKPWRIQLKLALLPDHGLLPSLQANDSAAQELLTYADWKTANIKWLCNSKFFAPSSCPKMQVGKHGVYDSAEHYMETVHKVWVAMTFADGHGALAPHCRTRGQAGGVGCCNNPLWPVSIHSTTITDFRCRTRGCPRLVEYSCRIKAHDALCGECAARSVANHLSGPGQNASTHVYDCKVKHVKSDGILYLVEFKSRNAPPTIHWRTTKRLSPPNLVAIVRVSAKGVSLKETDQIKWGEVTYHAHNRDEERRRLAGELAINISSIDEIDPDFFEEGSSVVVVRSTKQNMKTLFCLQ